MGACQSRLLLLPAVVAAAAVAATPAAAADGAARLVPPPWLVCVCVWVAGIRCHGPLSVSFDWLLLSSVWGVD